MGMMDLFKDDKTNKVCLRLVGTSVLLIHYLLVTRYCIFNNIHDSGILSSLTALLGFGLGFSVVNNFAPKNKYGGEMDEQGRGTDKSG